MGVAVNAELPILVLAAGIVCALIAWLLATFTSIFRAHRYRVTFGLIAFPLCGLMGLISTINAASFFGDWLAGKPVSVLYVLGYGGYRSSAFSAAGQPCAWRAGSTANTPWQCSTIWSKNIRNEI